jgi:nitrite reductase (NADH) small subunit
VKLGNKSVAIFKIGQEYYALDNVCLHRGGPLGEGTLEGYEVTCPWHGWTYDVRDGALSVIPALKVKTYPVRKEGNDLFLTAGN